MLNILEIWTNAHKKFLLFSFEENIIRKKIIILKYQEKNQNEYQFLNLSIKFCLYIKYNYIERINYDIYLDYY